jgi:NADH-quinone oxidoreductase subunit H
VISMVGETNRAPFDLPEAEGELVGGFHTEYSSLKFALFFLAEYINLATVSALATTLFLGGWRAPWPISLWSAANTGWWPVLWFFGKVFIFVFVFIWLRGTLPRMRYDQFMRLGWKVLIPVSLVWIIAVAAVRVARSHGTELGRILIGVGIVLAVLMLLYTFVLPEEQEPRTDELDELAEQAADRTGFAAGYPVPPMPGERPEGVSVAVFSSSSGMALSHRDADDGAIGGSGTTEVLTGGPDETLADDGGKEYDGG